VVDSRTIARLEARIKERVAHAVEFELSDPRSAFVTITRVELNRDLSHGRIFYSVLGSEADKSRVAHMLEDAAGFVQRKVGKVLNTRRVPRLDWQYDDSIEKMAEMDRLIRQALDKDRSINPVAHGELPISEEDLRQYELNREIERFESGLDADGEPDADGDTDEDDGEL
jgi:ribosome-binding factor A